jgi:hypothetical protein
MKRILVLILLSTVSLTLSSQKIIESGFDKFLKKNRIETNAIILDMKLSTVLTMSIRSIDSDILVKFSGRGYPISIIGDQEKIILLLDNDSTIELKSKGVQTYDRNGGANGLDKVFHYEYRTNENVIERLSVSKLSGVRIYFLENYSDIDIKTKKSELVNKLCNVFLQEYKKKIKQ